jgi:hypothetical protein
MKLANQEKLQRKFEPDNDRPLIARLISVIGEDRDTVMEGSLEVLDQSSMRLTFGRQGGPFYHILIKMNPMELP